MTSRLNKFADGDKITVASLFEKGIIKIQAPVKLRPKRRVEKKLEVFVPASAGAKAAIEKSRRQSLAKQRCLITALFFMLI